MDFEKSKAADEEKLKNHLGPLRPIEASGDPLIAISDQSEQVKKPFVVRLGRILDHRLGVSKSALA